MFAKAATQYGLLQSRHVLGLHHSALHGPCIGLAEDMWRTVRISCTERMICLVMSLLAPTS